MPENVEKENRFAGDKWVLESKIEGVEPVYDAFEKRFREAGWDESTINDFLPAISEAVSNAVIHGNLGLKKERGENLEIYRGRISEAEQNPELKNKKVVIDVHITEDEAVISITDEGGFDQSGLDQPDLSKVDSREYQEVLSGLGRGLMIAACDKVEFSPGKVVLCKKRKQNEF